MVTQFLLQMVRFRSVQSNLSQTEAPAGPSQPEQQNTAVRHEEPQKLVRRRSLSEPPDVSSLSTKDGTEPSTITQENQGSSASSNTQTDT
ncbi:hypothetical protein SRHO_G00034700 [Serrasalmus rhombeus]